MEVGVGQVRGAQRADRVVGAHVEGEVGAEQDPFLADRSQQLPQHLRVVDEGVEVQLLQIAARFPLMAGRRTRQAWSERPTWVGR